MYALFTSDAVFFDFRLEREVIEMGDYYQEIVEGSFPTLYTVVKPDFVLPNVSNTLLAELYLNESDEDLVRKSFELTGNPDPFNGTESLPCNENNPDWPDCLMVPGEPGTPSIGSGHGNVVPCSCAGNTNPQTPGGCIKVYDTELGGGSWQPVRRANVIIKSDWFGLHSTHTDDAGCWTIGHVINKPKIHMFVKFRNGRNRVRGTRNNISALWQWIDAVKHNVGEIQGPFYDNIQVLYDDWTVKGSAGHRYWAAATVNNSVHEFYDYSVADGIAVPPFIDILTGPNADYGFAIMGVQNQISSLAGMAFATATFFTGPLSVVIGLVGATAVQAWLPDVFIGTNIHNSDRLKRLAYHELAHASHYAQVGNGYWTNLASAEILANGWGTSAGPDADLISVTESWAEYLGRNYAHRTYPLGNNSLGSTDTWEKLLERSWNELPDHVPTGLYHDLLDVGEVPISYYGGNTNLASTTSIVDNVSGFTHLQMYSSLDFSVTSVDQFRLRLSANHLAASGNSQADVDALFNSY